MIKRICSFLIAVLIAAQAFAAPQAKAIRVDFTSTPEGADVLVDGQLRGITPLTLYDLTLGAHRAAFKLRNYENADDFFTLGDGAYAVRHVILEQQTGLLLLTSDPAGCDISLEGISFGQTPRLITTLPVKGTYRFVLQKPGYQSRTLEVKFDGRKPLVRHESLTLDSGEVAVTSIPEQANVRVNGIERGKTPVTVSGVPKGRTTIEITKEGFLPMTREVSLNAGDRQTVSVILEEQAGSMFLSSVPSGARFYVDGQPRGIGPVKIPNVKPGTYNVRAELEGYATVDRAVNVLRGKETNEEFRLDGNLGRIEIKTSPPGAQVFLDGHSCGFTKSRFSEDMSDIFTIEKVPVGERTVTIRKDGYAEVVRHPVVTNSKTQQVLVRMKRVFKPNVVITTSSGTYRGVFKDNNAETITLEVSMGITRSFPREDVLKIDFIDQDK